ncbi:cytochrome c oxidase accessory protein CcoG [Halarcobacter ebronensis]|uniref:Cytochrome c oxidase accessory protein CcoG n=1 Tax=Halarcobacter ebronensis TaxID=1462615 RepID=A0A4Q0Y7L6_9BACT|nr:cytochrome c oxidase accessory protein CcoG [Halarcobacter ebronensis]RXJ65454.1 cytochrome c oxidase accessory protein CcoG [Halarcobacter ebronensis]
MSYTKKRYLTYGIFTLFILILPYITVDGKHMLMLSFEYSKFHFLGFVFDVNELFIMPFLLMILFIGIFAITTIFGRVWCGWACPQTIFRVVFRDLIETKLLGLRRLKNKQKDIDYSKKSNQIKKYLALIIWAFLCLIAASNFMWYFIPPEDFFTYILSPKEHSFMILFVITIAAFLFYDIVFWKEDFCTYTCPYSRIQSVLYDDNTVQVVYNTNRGGEVYKNNQKSIFDVKQWNANEECTTCEACVKVCPTHIDIRKGLQVECINCLECSDACNTVMGKLGKSSLIVWGSTNSVIKNVKTKLFSKRNLAYMASILVCVFFAMAMLVEKKDFIVNINKTTQLYKIAEDKTVSNNYLFTFANSQDKELLINIELENKKDFEIKRFESFILKPNQRVKKVVVVKSKKRLFLSDTKDTALNLKVDIFANENRDKKQTWDLSFIYPRESLLK